MHPVLKHTAQGIVSAIAHLQTEHRILRTWTRLLWKFWEAKSKNNWKWSRIIGSGISEIDELQVFCFQDGKRKPYPHTWCPAWYLRIWTPQSWRIFKANLERSWIQNRQKSGKMLGRPAHYRIWNTSISPLESVPRVGIEPTRPLRVAGF